MAITNDFFTALNDPKAAMWSAGVAFNRSNPLPLDKWSVFQTMDEAVTYAESNAVAYPGQVIAVYDADAATMSAYILQEVTVDEATKLEPVAVGTTPVGDESSVVVAEDGTVSLKGVAGLVFTEQNEEGEDVSVVYQPLMTSAGLTWVRPSATTVEGLATEIEGLKTRLTAAEGDIDALEGVVGKAAEGENEATGLVKDVADIKAAIGVEASEGVEATGLEKKIADEIAAREAGDEANAEDIAALELAIYGREAAEGIEAVKGLDDLIAENAQGISDLDAKIGEVAEGKTVVEMIADAEGKIPTNVSAFTNDSKYQTESEVQATVSAAIAEINHAVFEKVEAVPAVAEAEANVLYLVPNGEKMDIYAKIGEEMVLIDDTDTDLSGYALKSELHEHANKELLDTYDQTNADITDAVAKKHEHSFADSDVEDAIAKKHEHTNFDLLETYNQTNDDLTDAVAKKHEHANADVIDGITAEKVAAWDAAEVNAIASVDETQFALDDDKKLSLAAVEMDKVTGLDDALAGKVDVEDGKSLISDTLISKLEGVSEGAQVNAIDSVDETQFALDASKKLTLLDIAMGKVTGLQTALDGKADRGTTLAAYGITDAYTKTETEGRIQEVLDGLSDTSETAASVAQALETYKTSNDGRVDTIEGKLANIADGAQVNILEAVKINGTALEIAEKAVNIPVATSTILGVVTSSAAENKVAVAEDGTMEVNSLNVDKLVQDEGSWLILDGGASK